MSPLYVTAFLIFVLVGIGKIVWIWGCQSYKLLVSKIPNPGIPLPILGHSHYFVNVLPHEVLDVVLGLVKKDRLCRKVRCIRIYYIILKSLDAQNLNLTFNANISSILHFLVHTSNFLCITQIQLKPYLTALKTSFPKVGITSLWKHG